MSHAEGEGREDALRRHAIDLAVQNERLVNAIQTRLPGTDRPSCITPNSKSYLAVPNGSEVATGPTLAPVRGDLVALKEHAISNACAAFKVPPALVSRGSAQRSALNPAEARAFNSSVASLAAFVSKRILQPALLMAYQDTADYTVNLIPSVVVHSEDVSVASACGVPRPYVVRKAMMSLGCSEKDIEAAIEDIKAEQEVSTQQQQSQQQQQLLQLQQRASSETSDEVDQ